MSGTVTSTTIIYVAPEIFAANFHLPPTDTSVPDILIQNTGAQCWVAFGEESAVGPNAVGCFVVPACGSVIVRGAAATAVAGSVITMQRGSLLTMQRCSVSSAKQYQII